MDNELFELCKEVYKRTGWKTGRHIWSLKNPKVCKGDNFMDGMSFPLYTSDYLLEKLQGFDLETYHYANDNWHAFIGEGDYEQSSDTPLKSLLKLTIALDDAGELKRNLQEGEQS